MDNVRDFRERHGLSDAVDLAIIEPAIESIAQAREVILTIYNESKHSTEQWKLFSLTHVNLLCRVFDQADGMLLCIAGNVGQSSEAIGRVVVESSVNLIFIFSNQNPSLKLVGYIDAWIKEHEKQMKTWRSLHTPEEDDGRLLYKIDSRLSWVSDQNKYINQISEFFGVNRDEARSDWQKYNKLISRFEAVNKKPHYYSVYHRLSAASHLNAEETISWLQGASTNSEENMARISNESMAYSTMMAHIATAFALEASLIFCAINLKMDAMNEIKRNISSLYDSVGILSKAAGVPQ